MSAEVSDHWHFEILSPKQMFQSLSIAVALVKVGNISEIFFVSSKRNYQYCIYKFCCTSKSR